MYQESTNTSPEQPSSLDHLFSPIEQQILNQICETANFSLRPHPPGSPAANTFATDLVRKIIYYNEDHLKNWQPYRVFGVFIHELGHHFPQVLEVHNAMIKMKPLAQGLLPPLMNDRSGFVDYMINVLVDVYLEDVVPRSAKIVTGDLFKAALKQDRALIFMETFEEEKDQLIEQYEASGRKVFPWRESMFSEAKSRYGQLHLITLVAPFYQYPPVEMLHPDVAAVIPELMNLLNQLRNPQISLAHQAYQLIKYTEIVKSLLEKDLEESEENPDFVKFLEDLFGEWEKLRKKFKKVTEPVDEVNEGDNPGDQPGGPGKLQPIKKGRDIKDEMNQKFKAAIQYHDEKEIAALVMTYNVTPRTAQRFLEISRKYAAEIESLKKCFINYILREYRKEQVKGEKFGLITPGREVETFSRQSDGERYPSTYINRKNVVNPRATEIRILIDTSGSMITELKGTENFYVILSMAIMEVHKEMRENRRKYDFRRMKQKPLQLEIVGFDYNPLIGLELTANLTMMELMKGLEFLYMQTKNGGGTDDRTALKFELRRMQLGQRNVLKILCMITDGGGTGDAVEPIIRQIEDDRDICFLVNGIGNNSAYVREYYLKKFRPAHHYNVYADVSSSVEIAIPKLIAFIESRIANHYKPKNGRR